MTRRASQNRRRTEGMGSLFAASSLMLLFLVIPFIALAASVDWHTWLGTVRSDQVMPAFWISVRTTLLATLCCVVFGLPVAYLLARFNFLGREIVDTLVDLPISVPPVVVGIALLLAFGKLGLIGKHLDAFGITVGFTTTAVVMAQVTIACPFFVKTMRAGFEAVDPKLESASRVLGASPWRTFWRVTLPLARPALLAGTLLAWARALSEFGATMMFAGNRLGTTQTLPLAVMNAFNSNVHTASAIAMLALMLSITALVAAKVLTRRWRIVW